MKRLIRKFPDFVVPQRPLQPGVLSRTLASYNCGQHIASQQQRITRRTPRPFVPLHHQVHHYYTHSSTATTTTTTTSASASHDHPDTSSTAVSSAGAPKARLEERTDEILDPAHPLPADTEALWQEAEDLLHSWLDPRHGMAALQRVDQCLDILDRLTTALPKGEIPLFGSHLPTDLLNRIVLLWRKGVVQELPSGGGKGRGRGRGNNNNRQHRRHPHKSTSGLGRFPQKFTPSRMAEKIDKYRFASLVQPDCQTYNILLDAAASFPYREGVLFADSLLEKLVQLAHQHHHEEDDYRYASSEVILDEISIGSVIKAWVQHGDPAKAETWLTRLNEWSSSSSSSLSSAPTVLREIRSNQILYASVIAGWAQQGNFTRAQAIFRVQLQDFSDGNDNARPDRMTFNSLFNALSKSNKQKNKISIADSLVEEMKDYDSTLGWDCAPDKYTWTSLLACYASEDPERAEKLLDELVHKHNVTLVSFAYNQILQGYAKHGRAMEALQFLNRTLQKGGIDNADHGDSRAVVADEISYNIVLSALAKSKGPEIGVQATALLAQMKEHGIPPSVVSYGSLLDCWAKSQDPMAAERAEDVFCDMEEDGVEPNILCYNILFTIWSVRARTNQDPRAVERMVRLLHELLANPEPQGTSSSTRRSQRIKPTDATYRAVLHAIVGGAVKDKGRKVHALIKLMERHGHSPNPKDHKLIQRFIGGNK